MKLVALIVMFLFALSSLNAQGYNSMTQDQLNLALEKANKSVSTGSTLTVLGGIALVGGILLYANGLTDMVEEDYSEIDSNLSKSLLGIVVITAGIGCLGAGIPTAITGKNRRDKIEIALLKFKTTGLQIDRGSSPIYGIGLKVTF